MMIRHTAHARYEPWYHFAWSTKYRKKVWTDPQQRHKTPAKTIMAGVCFVFAHHYLKIERRSTLRLYRNYSKTALMRRTPWLTASSLVILK